MDFQVKRGDPSPGPDRQLENILRDFKTHAGVDDSPVTNISVVVNRGKRFTNVATTPRGLSIEMDEPADFGGTGERPDPAEYLLAAVGSSLSVTLTAHAALRGLAIHSVEIALAADIDGRSFFAPRTWPRAGLLNMQIDITLTSDLSEARARALTAEVLRASPVFRSLKRRPKVTLALRDIP